MSRQKITKEMEKFFAEVREHMTVGLVGGSDLAKISEQMGREDVLDKYHFFDYVFSENGLVAHKGREEIGRTSIREKVNKNIKYIEKEVHMTA